MKRILILVSIIAVFLPLVVSASNLKKYYVDEVFDDDKILVEDGYGDKYLVEYGIGCLSMWRYEDKYIYIDIGGSYLDGIGDRIYLFDSDDDCRVWDADEASSGGSSSASPLVTALLYCTQAYGQGATVDVTTYKCICLSDYQVGPDGKSCVKKPVCTDLVNGYVGSDNKCYCNKGYEWSSIQDKCIMKVCKNANQFLSEDDGMCHCAAGYVMKYGNCLTANQDCESAFGPNTYGTITENNASNCFCNDGYAWNSSRTRCVESSKPVIIEKPTPVPVAPSAVIIQKKVVESVPVKKVEVKKAAVKPAVSIKGTTSKGNKQVLLNLKKLFSR